MRYGSRVAGRFVPIDPNVQTLSEPQGIYEIAIQTEGIPDEQMAIQQLLTLEEQFEDLKILYIETIGMDIKMQITDVGPGGWSFVGLMALIPAILVSVLILVVGFGLWQIVSVNPIILFLVILGGIALVISTTGLKLPTPKTIRMKSEEGEKLSVKVSRKAKILTSRRVGLEKQTKAVAAQIDKINAEIQRFEKRRDKLEETKPKGYTSKVRELETKIENMYKQREPKQRKFDDLDAKHDDVLEEMSEMTE